MVQLAGWVAPIATMIAALMTAANLGPRVTGWGFVVFTIGAIAWAAIGLATGQSNLLWQNVLLLVVDIFGIWRWLGQVTRWEEGAISAVQASERAPVPTLFPSSLLTGGRVADRRGEHIGHSVDAMLNCKDGEITYVVIRSGGVGGVGETLREVPWRDMQVVDDVITLDLETAAFDALPPIDPERWPERA
jgi:sporulation protein YlmC with PRC-barrel domain